MPSTRPTATRIRRVAIIGGNRLPFARANTAYSHASNQDMLTAAIDGLVDRFDLRGERLGEVVAGAVLKHSRDFNLTRESVLGSRLSPETACLRHPAGVRYRDPGRDRGRRQDRRRRDRGRDRRRCGHRVGRADRRQRKAPQDHARCQSGQVGHGAAGGAGPDSARASRAVDTAERRTPYPAVDG